MGVLALLLFLFPIFWMVLTSFKTTAQAFTSVPILVFTPTLENYREVLLGRNFLHYIQNSLVIGLISTLLTLALAVTVAYPLARYKLKGDRPSHLMDPVAAHHSAHRLGRSALIIFSASTSPISTGPGSSCTTFEPAVGSLDAAWLLPPTSHENWRGTALVDGSTPIGSFFRIALPLVARSRRRRHVVAHLLLERVPLRQCPDCRPHQDRTRRTDRVRDPGERPLDADHGEAPSSCCR